MEYQESEAPTTSLQPTILSAHDIVDAGWSSAAISLRVSCTCHVRLVNATFHLVSDDLSVFDDDAKERLFMRLVKRTSRDLVRRQCHSLIEATCDEDVIQVITAICHPDHLDSNTIGTAYTILRLLGALPAVSDIDRTLLECAVSVTHTQTHTHTHTHCRICG